ncbi:hypothetical protein MMUR_54790 [Mycolicibacterium murale]|uniref:DUF8171 domain-containing protein n=1 Tax=Mycolicibacterium murale TaxID=182220 RepID=A0A7I9WUL2_9MYCO|nr:hypothetical protein [Mycolicibacterium murale]MCV7185788.1 cell division protein FtsQ [Mycolicibacterium murale]GFG61343.1 hypothetical protein MMUR_54790 [Mycolicibacterium murale]
MSIPESLHDAADDFRDRLHTSDVLSGSQKLMILVLSMTLYGVGDIVAQMIPSIEYGPMDIGVSYFSFIAVVLAALLPPAWVALGAPLGELVFSDMLLGDFGGFAEVEGWLETSLAIYIAGCFVRNPRSIKQLFMAPVIMVLVDKVSGGIIDIAKVAVGIDPETLEESDGLFSAFLFAEGIDLVITIITSGILFGALPAIWLAPRLYGKIEPIMGLRPRDPANPPRLRGPWGTSIWAVAGLAFVAAAAVAMLAAWQDVAGNEGLSTFGAFEPDYVDRFGDAYLWIAAALAAVIGFAVFFALRAVRSRRER